MIHSDYYILNHNQYFFSHSEWLTLVASGTTAALMSISCGLFVLSMHTVLVLKKNDAASRLSIRMIVISCACNILFCTLQVVSYQISSKVHSCRALIYLIMAADTMSCMSLAMIGFNLVVIFVFKVSKSHKVNMCYYIVVLLSGIATFIVPLIINVKKPMSKIPSSTCWYHYYYEGRMTKLFNWVWYYGWLFLSLVFAAFCAVISIRYVIKKQQDLAGALDTFAQRERADEASRTSRRYTTTNDFVFIKIARRCVCYPLIPLLSKIWGVSISISAIQKVHIPFSIFILDLVFSCLLGFMVTCVYLTDPAICSFIREIRYKIKKKYIYDYYAIQYRAGIKQDGTRPSKRDNPRTLNLVPLQEDTPESYKDSIRSSLINTQYQQQLEALGSSQSYHPPIVKIKKVCGIPVTEYNLNNRRYSVLVITSVCGDVYLPNQINSGSSSATSTPIFKSSIFHSSVIPMRRTVHRKAIQVLINDSNQPESSSSSSLNRSNMIQHTEFVETLVAYKYPRLAKCIHWFLSNILRVKPLNDEENHDVNDTPEPQRVFRDFTNSSNPTLSFGCPVSDAIPNSASPTAQRLNKPSDIPDPIDEKDDLPSMDSIMTADNENKTQDMNPKSINSLESDDLTSVTDYKSKITNAIIPAGFSSSSTKYQSNKQPSLENPEHSFIDKLKASLPSASNHFLAKDKDSVSKKNSKKQRKQDLKCEYQSSNAGEDFITSNAVKQLETDVIFPSELSPPPRSHYRQQQQLEGSGSDDMKVKEPQQTTTAKKTSNEKSKKKKGKEVEKKRSRPIFDDFGFATGSSRLSYISNWSDGRDRVEVKESQWDVEQDIQDQIELVDNLSHNV